MAEVEVGFGSVVGDVALAVLVGVQGTRINVEVGVKLLNGYRKPTGLEKFGERRSHNALAQ